MTSQDLPGDGPRRRSAFPGFDGLVGRRHELARSLATLRGELGLSQTEVAARMGTSQSAVARLEAGDADPRLSTLERYAEAIGQPLDWTFGHRADTGPRNRRGSGS